MPLTLLERPSTSIEAPAPPDTPIAAATGALVVSAGFTRSPAMSGLQNAWTRKRAADDIFILQLVRLVNDTQNFVLRNIFLLRLVHYQYGTSFTLLELEFSLEGGKSQVGNGDVWCDRNLSLFDVGRGHDHVLLRLHPLLAGTMNETNRFSNLAASTTLEMCRRRYTHPLATLQFSYQSSHSAPP